MPEWVTCPGCGLKHTARSDGACPRCRQPIVDSSTPAPLAAPAPPTDESAQQAPSAPQVYAEPPLTMTYDEPAVPSAARAAGLVLIGNGLLHLVATLVMGVSQGPMAFGGLVSVVIDFVVGGYLLAGNERALVWAKVRVGLGLVLLPFIQYAAGGLVLAAFQVAFSAGLLLLLVGTPGVLRLGLGVAASGLCLLLEMAGLLAVGIGTNPLSRFVLSAQTEGSAVKVVDGREFRYRLQTASDGWYLRKTSLSKKDNPEADRWLIHPGQDAHVLVIAERVGATDRVDMDALANVVLQNARNVAPNLTVVQQRPLENPQGAGRLLHTRAKMHGQGMEFYYGLYTREPEVYQLVAFTFEKNFKKVEPSLYEWVSSLQTPGWQPPGRYSTFQRP
jgi:hypothetical protein